jgi:hypothetical protein
MTFKTNSITLRQPISVETSDRVAIRVLGQLQLVQSYIDSLGAMKILLQTTTVALNPSDAATGLPVSCYEQ